jgi:hypothetical protein
LTKSAFSDYRTYAVLTLARHGDRYAVGPLLEMQENERTQRTDVLVLVNWYLLKFVGQAGPAVREIAKSLK